MRTLATRARAINQYNGLGNQLWDLAGNRPSLDLRFAESKSLVDATTGTNLVDFTRASSGTYVGSDGLIKTATTNEPRFDHDPTTGESLGLLVEEARTNFLLQSSASNLSPWQRIQATVTPDVSGVLAPDGTQTADFLAENTATSEHYDDQSVAVTAGTTYVYSRFYKGTGAGNRIVWHRVAGVANAGVTFNPDTLSGIDGASFVEYYSNGWIRVSTVFTAASTGNAILRAQVREGAVSPGTSSYTGNGTSGFYTWGAQLEEGSFPTSYIPTVGAGVITPGYTTPAVTRAADVASISGANFSSWYNASEGTLFAEYLIPSLLPGTVASFDDGTANNRWQMRYMASPNRGRYRFASSSGAFDLTSTTALPTANQFSKSAYVAKAGDQTWATNAVISTAIGSQATMPTVNQIQIGVGAASDQAQQLTIRRLCYWSQRLPDSTLQTITN